MTLRLYPHAPFQQGVPPPDIDPDSIAPDSLVCVSYQGAWQPYVLGALTTLLARQTWEGSESDVTLAVKRSNLLLDLFMGDDCIMPGIFDLQQSGLLILRQDTPGGDWSTLYDPRNLVIITTPDATYPNIINATANVRGLWAKQAGGDIALVGSQQGATGRAGLLGIDHASNTDEVLLLDRAAQNGDLLRVKPGVGATYTAINRYGHISTIIHNANLPTANQYTVGSIIYLINSASPTTAPDGPYIGAQSGSSYFWSQFKGPAGTTGGTGAAGLPAIMYLNSVLTGYPNEDPDFTLTPDAAPNTNNRYAVGVKLPRAATWSKQTTIVRDPNEDPTVAVSTDTHGDKLIQFGLPRMLDLSIYPPTPVAPNATLTAYIDTDSHGDKKFGFGVPRSRDFSFLSTVTGAPGSAASFASSHDTNGDIVGQFTVPRGAAGSEYIFDDQPPALGETKHYSMQIDGLGCALPFRLPKNFIITNFVSRGFWGNNDNQGERQPRYLCDHTGLNYGETEPRNYLQVSSRPYLGASTPQFFSAHPYNAQPAYDVYDEYEIWFDQAQNSTVPYAQGFLWIDFDIAYQTPQSVIGVHDFEPDEAGWHVVTQALSHNVNWGGQWLAGTGGHGGFHPTYNNIAGMYALSISPAPETVHINDVQIYWEDALGQFGWQVEYKQGGTWHNTSTVIVSGTGGNSTINVNQDCTEVMIHMNSFGIGTTDWRIRKAIVTGT